MQYVNTLLLYLQLVFQDKLSTYSPGSCMEGTVSCVLVYCLPLTTVVVRC